MKNLSPCLESPLIRTATPILIAKVENLWLILHQKKLVSATRTISQAMARGFEIKELKKKRLN